MKTPERDTAQNVVKLKIALTLIREVFVTHSVSPHTRNSIIEPLTSMRLKMEDEMNDALTDRKKYIQGKGE